RGHHLALRLRIQVGRPRADRPLQRDRRRLRRRTGAMAADGSAQHLPAHPRDDLDPDRLRDGGALGGHQGHPDGADRGGPARRHQRLAAVPQRDGARHPGLARRGADDHLDRHPQGLRHRPHDDGGQLQHERRRQRAVHAGVPRLGGGARIGARDHPLRARAADRHLQRQRASQAEGEPMSSGAPADLPVEGGKGEIALAVEHRRDGGKAKRVKQRLTSRGATVAALIIAVLWTIPTFGLFISSFRPAELILNTGWWTIFQNPGFTLDNYRDVLLSPSQSSPQLGAYFVNSLFIAFPSTIFPLVFASMAAYAFAWMRFKWVNWLFIFVFALQIVPLQMALVPLLQFFSTFLKPGQQ